MFSTTTINNAADKSMLRALTLGFPFSIGIPVWQIKHLQNREESPMSLADIMGQSPRYRDSRSLGDEHADMKGYQFSWGIIAEDFTSGEEFGPGNPDMVTWEFCPEQLLQLFCDPEFLEDVMVSMCANHPLASSEFDCDSANGSFFTLRYIAVGAEKIAELRKWLATTFVPEILPDVLVMAERLIRKTEGDPVQRNREWLNWMCMAQSGDHLMRAMHYQERKEEDENKLVGADVAQTDPEKVPKAWMT